MSDYHPANDQYTCRDCNEPRPSHCGGVMGMRHTIDESDATYLCLVCAGERTYQARKAAGFPQDRPRPYRPQLVREPRYTDKPIERMTPNDWYWEDQYREDEINREDMDQAGANIT